MVYIRGIRGISGQHNIIHTRMFFRTRIGLIGRIFLGCDIVYIRLIRGISGQVNIIHTRIYFFEHESDESDESYRLRHGIYSWDSGD